MFQNQCITHDFFLLVLRQHRCPGPKLGGGGKRGICPGRQNGRFWGAPNEDLLVICLKYIYIRKFGKAVLRPDNQRKKKTELTALRNG